MKGKKLKLFIVVLTLLLAAGHNEGFAASGQLPEATELWYQGIAISGRMLYGKYTYVSDFAEQGSLYRWLLSDTKNGEYKPIDGATSKNYALTDAEAGKYIKFEVTPGNRYGLGKAVSTEGYPVSKESVPVLTGVKIIGSCKSGEQLWVDYHFSDANGEPELDTYFRWQASDDGEHFQYIENAAAQSFTPDDSYCGKYIRASVKANKLGSTLNSAKGEKPESAEVFSDAVKLLCKPAAAAVSIFGADTLTGSYSFYAAGGVEENGSRYFWQASAEKNGEYKTVSEQISYAPPRTNKDYYLRFAVIPVNECGTEGDIAYSEAVKISGIAGEQDETDNAAVISGRSFELYAPEACFVDAAVIELYSENDGITVSSELFNVAKAVTDEKIILSLVPKNGETVYCDGGILVGRMNGAAGASVLGIKSVSLGKSSDEAALGIREYSQVSKYVFRRTVHHYSKQPCNVTMAAVVYGSDGRMKSCSLSDEVRLEGYAAADMCVEAECDEDDSVKVLMLNLEAMQPFTLVAELKDGVLYDENPTNYNG